MESFLLEISDSFKMTSEISRAYNWSIFSNRPRRPDTLWVQSTLRLWPLNCISLCSFWIDLYSTQLLGEHDEIWMQINAGARMTHGVHSQRFSQMLVRTTQRIKKNKKIKKQPELVVLEGKERSYNHSLLQRHLPIQQFVTKISLWFDKKGAFLNAEDTCSFSL